MILEADLEHESVDGLKKIIDSFLKREEQYLSEIKILKEQVRSLRDTIFGSKSEKEPIEDKQLSLFDPPEENFPIAEQPTEEDEVRIPAHKRKKRGRKAIPENLPRVEVIHDIDDADKLCECGCLKKCIGEEISEQLDIIPAKIQVIRNIRPKYACKNCEGVESDGPTVAIAPLPEQIISKCIGTPGLVAFVMVAKFVDALPFYRQEKQFLRIGVKISRATMCNWAQKISESCEILLSILKKEILSGPLIQIDETPVQVHNEPGKKNTSKSYMWIFRGGPQDRPTLYLIINPPVQAMLRIHF